MNKLENAGILNWRRWSVVRKAQVVGMLVGAFSTIAMPLIVHLYGRGPATFLLLLLWEVVLWPADRASNLFGWKWQFGVRGPSLAQTSLAIFTNAFLLFLVGTLIGWIVGKFKKPQREICAFE